MSRKTNPTLIGSFVVGAVALLAVGVALFGGSEIFAKRYAYVAYFTEQTKGLRVGSNVLLNGVRVGYVDEIALLIDESNYETITQVTMEILPDTFVSMRNGRPVGEGIQSSLSHDQMVRVAGLRAQLEIESFVTGQLLIRLDLRPETEIVLRGIESEYPEIPTITSNIQELLARVQAWLSDIREDVDVAALAESLTNALNGVGRLSSSDDLHEVLSGLNTLVNAEDTQALTASMRRALDDVSRAADEAAALFARADGELADFAGEVGPVLDRLGKTLQTAERTLSAARLQLRGDSEQVYQLQSTLKEVESAAIALRDFFDYLERNPEALIRGKNP